MIRRFFVFALLLAAPLMAQLPPEKAGQSFTVSDGLEFKLWASEPLFVNPTCMDVDHKGRVWVVESVNYRNRLRGMKKFTRPSGDRIVILEDSKGTGVADTATTFYQSPEIMAPLGITVAKDPTGPGYKVFVAQSPDILLFTDKDGDGKADGPPTKLLTGFRGIDHDHGVHSVLIGPDLKLYFTVGDSGVGGLKSSDGKGREWTSNSTDCRAGTVWRCELDGTKLELIAHNFRNNYEACVDSFGTVFLSDNDDDGNQQTRICHVIPGGNYGYHPRGKGESHWHEEQPGVMPKILRTYFGSPTGICVYEGKLLPKAYQGQLLHTDAGPRHVRAYHLKSKGASYEVDREDVVQTKDNWFRPSDVCVGPDGSVYVADWYDPGVGGHGMGDIKQGRIYRLAPKNSPVQNPKVDLSTTEGFAATLNSPALSVRYMAMAHVQAMAEQEAVKLLQPLATQKDDPVLRSRAVWQLARKLNSATRSAALSSLASDPDPRFQVLALRLAKDYSNDDAATLTKNLAAIVARSSDAMVSREALVALRDVDPVAVKDTLYELMKRYDGKDRHYLATIGIAVGTDPKRRDAILGDFSKHFSTFDDKVAGLVFELRPPGMAALVRKRIEDKSLPVAERALLLNVLVNTEDKDAPQLLLDLVQGKETTLRGAALQLLATHLPTKWQSTARSEELAQTINKLLSSATTRTTGLELIGVAVRVDLTPKVIAIAKDESIEPAQRREAITVMGVLPSSDGVVTLVSLGQSTSSDVAQAALQSLGNLSRQGGLKDPIASQAVKELENLMNAKQVDTARLAAIALTASRPGSVRLLELHAAGKLSAVQAAQVGPVLRNSPYPDLQNRALIAFPPPGRFDVKKLPSIAELAARKGSIERGKNLFDASVKSNLACAKCHMVRGKGGQIGPDLSMIGKKASRENLIESILYPSKAVADQFVTWIITTKRGVVMQGLIVEDTEAGVVIRDAEGRDTRISIKQIEKREKSSKSLMPEDIVGLLSPDDLVDLVEYLLTLKTA